MRHDIVSTLQPVARGYVTRLPVPVSQDTPGALPCELAFGFLPHDGPWKRHRKADAELPRGRVMNLITLRNRRASLKTVCVTVPADGSSVWATPDPDGGHQKVTHESFRVVFEPGTRLSAAWRACGVELPEPRYPPWHAYRPDGVLVITVWRNDPNAGRWVQWNPGDAGFRLALREPGSIPGESEQSLRKLRAYNEAVEKAARDQKRIIVLVLDQRQTNRGEFVALQLGRAGPAEAWSAWIGEVSGAGNLPYSVVATQQYPRSPFDPAA